MFSMPGITELILIAAIVMLLFGGKILKNSMRAAGEIVHETRKIKKQVEEK